MLLADFECVADGAASDFGVAISCSVAVGALHLESGDNEQADEDDENCPFSTTESTPVVFHCVVFKRALNEDELIESS